MSMPLGDVRAHRDGLVTAQTRRCSRAQRQAQALNAPMEAAGRPGTTVPWDRRSSLSACLVRRQAAALRAAPGGGWLRARATRLQEVEQRRVAVRWCTDRRVLRHLNPLLLSPKSSALLLACGDLVLLGAPVAVQPAGERGGGLACLPHGTLEFLQRRFRRVGRWRAVGRAGTRRYLRDRLLDRLAVGAVLPVETHRLVGGAREGRCRLARRVLKLAQQLVGVSGRELVDGPVGLLDAQPDTGDPVVQLARLR